MKIEVFGKDGCAICQTTKRKIAHFLEKWGANGKVKFSFVDIATVDGMAEAAFNDVGDKIPVTIISENGSQLARWQGEAPPSEEIKRILEG